MKPLLEICLQADFCSSLYSIGSDSTILWKQIFAERTQWFFFKQCASYGFKRQFDTRGQKLYPANSHNGNFCLFLFDKVNELKDNRFAVLFSSSTSVLRICTFLRFSEQCVSSLSCIHTFEHIVTETPTGDPLSIVIWLWCCFHQDEILNSQISNQHNTPPWSVQPKKVGKFRQAIDNNKRVKISLFALLSLTCSQYWDFPNYSQNIESDIRWQKSVFLFV